MKKIIQLTLLLSFMIGTTAWSSDRILELPFGNLQPFTTDQCTKFPNGTHRDSTKWEHCCVEHDVKYWAGGSYRERVAADRELYQCVKNTGEPRIALLMYSGVRVGGNPFLFSTWRWGYGWPALRGYSPLSSEELRQVQSIIF